MPSVKIGDINVEYYVEGQGPPLLMIMGWIGHAGFWGEEFLDGLRPHFQTIRLSNRGTGLTEKPDGDVSVPIMAEDTAGLLRELGIPKAHVLGISMGGMIAQELVLNHPEAVQGLVLGCTNCGFGHSVPPKQEVFMRLSKMGGLSPDEVMRQWLIIATTPGFVEKAGDGFFDWVKETYMAAPTPIAMIGRHFLAMQQFDTFERLPMIESPTFIIHGDEDELVPAGNAEVLHGRIEGSEVRIVPGAGHCFFWEKPAESAGAIVEFLSAVPAPA